MLAMDCYERRTLLRRGRSRIEIYQKILLLIAIGTTNPK
jgi:hypothetical protein